MVLEEFGVEDVLFALWADLDDDSGRGRRDAMQRLVMCLYIPDRTCLGRSIVLEDAVSSVAIVG